MAGSSVILHADMDAFYASIEQRDRPELRGRAVVVGGLGRRGVVAAASYEARGFGVHSAQPMARARRLCPQGIFLTPRMERYAAESERVFGVFERYTDLVEPLSLDEAFLDVTASVRLLGDGPTIARRLRAEVAAETGLAVSVGVAACKYVAKVASDAAKPDGLVVVPAGREEDFLASLPIRCLWGVGPATAERLAARALTTIGDVQRFSREGLVALLGEALGAHLHALAHGQDERPVSPERAPKSIGRETTFEHDLVDEHACRQVLLELAEDVGARLRSGGWRGRSVRLKVRFPPFETVLRQTRVAPTDDDLTIYRTAAELLAAARPPGRPVRLLGVGLSDLEPVGAPRQGELFGHDSQAGRRVHLALDEIRRRFGSGAAHHGGAAPRSRDEPT